MPTMPAERTSLTGCGAASLVVASLAAGFLAAGFPAADSPAADSPEAAATARAEVVGSAEVAGNRVCR